MKPSLHHIISIMKEQKNSMCNRIKTEWITNNAPAEFNFKQALCYAYAQEKGVDLFEEVAECMNVTAYNRDSVCAYMRAGL